MSAENSVSDKSQRETGAVIHRRESMRQIYLPFALGLLLLLTMLLIVALPSAPIWRIRAQAVADWTVIILCLIPIVFCILPLFMLLAMSVWGMNRVHSSTERPLRKLENLSAGLATRIDNVSEYINQKTIDTSSTIEPVMTMISAFDTPQVTDEEVSDDGTE
ncbi:MAG: hypothetical protein Q9P01_12900 [Anaerolineae bacterium]|nr:hypothetical protein [Anaerolineae bacterium]MDQ7035690.1 hypothetical protein [Anaerolineae bacterium]